MNPKQFNLLLLALGAMLMLSSCSCAWLCNGNIAALANEIVLYNFTTTELDSIVVKLYTASSNFSNPFDSAGYKGKGPAGQYTVFYNNTNASIPDSLLNILVYFPKDSLTYRVTNISTGFAPCPQCKSVYIKVVTGYTVNGVSSTGLSANSVSIYR